MDDSSESNKKKRTRTPNYTVEERSLILDLVESHVSVIENKKVDSFTTRQKNAVWMQIAGEFNTLVEVNRTWDQLKSAYESMKKKAKKASAAEGVQQQQPVMHQEKAAIVPPSKKVDASDERILSMMVQGTLPDSDGEYQNTTESPHAHSSTSNDDYVPGGLKCEDNAFETDRFGGPNVVTVEVLPDVNSVVESSAPSSPSGSDHGGPNWSLRQRSQVGNGAMRDHTDARTIYYREKLKMAKIEHEARLRLLEMQRSLLDQQIKELMNKKDSAAD